MPSSITWTHHKNVHLRTITPSIFPLAWTRYDIWKHRQGDRTCTNKSDKKVHSVHMFRVSSGKSDLCCRAQNLWRDNDCQKKSLHQITSRLQTPTTGFIWWWSKTSTVDRNFYLHSANRRRVLSAEIWQIAMKADDWELISNQGKIIDGGYHSWNW